MRWPQITLIVLCMINQLILVFQVGSGKSSLSDLHCSWLSLLIVHSLLWAGGFYSGGVA